MAIQLESIETKIINQQTFKDIDTGKIYLVVDTSKEFTENSHSIIEIFETEGTTGEWKRITVFTRSTWDHTSLMSLLKQIINPK